MAACCPTSGVALALTAASGPAGPAARRIDDLWVFMLVLGTAVFVLFGVLLAGALRRRASDRSGDGRDPVGRWLVGGGVVLPLVVVGAVLVMTIQVMGDIPEVVDTEETIVVTGHRWWWEVDYRGHGVSTRNEVHIPAGEPVQLQLRSADVIHSFWVPALAGKRDLLPERTNHLVIEADAPGRYEGQCAEFCGLHHATMRLVVVAHDRASFDRWLEQRRS